MEIKEELYSKIKAKLEFEPGIDETKITTGIHNDIVTLGGVVGTYAEKLAAERAAYSVYGVKAVANEIEVNVAERFRHSDVEIAKAALDSLQWNVDVPYEKIQVTVEKGHITLRGEVDWWFQRKSAEDAVRSLSGVISLNNQITIGTRVTLQLVKEKIIKEFERNAALDAKRIKVECLGNKVILTGSVRSWAEKQEAAQACWAIPGITEVDNHLVIY